MYAYGFIIGISIIGYYLFMRESNEFDEKKEEALAYVRMQKEREKEKEKELGLRNA